MAQVENAVAPSKSILRPGDTVLLSLPGETTLNNEVQVKRNGKLLLPEIGEVYVQGLSVPEATAKIKSLLQDVIHDLSSFELIMKQRRLIVSVLGYVKSPGTVDLAHGATIQEAITAADGLMPGAQLNKLQVRRDGQVHRFDYKYYLDSGDPSKLPILQPLDTVFVPSSSLIGNVQVDFDASALTAGGKTSNAQAIQLFGEVIKPGSYDWSEALSLFDLITHAGGPKDKANLSKIKILSRDKDNNITSRLFDMATFVEQGGAIKDIPALQPRDTVIVPSLALDSSDEKSKWVSLSSDDSIYVMGEVAAPGRYLFNNRMHFLDILTAAKGPTDKADIHNIRVTHRNGKQARVSQLNLGRYFELGDESLLPLVKTGDVIYVPSKARSWLDERVDKTIRVLGAVNKQGRYRFDASMTILDLLAQAGGLAPTAQISDIVVVSGQSNNKQINHFDLLDFSKTGDFSQLPDINNGDTVYVLHREDSTWNRVVDSIQETVSVLSILKVLGGG